MALVMLAISLPTTAVQRHLEVSQMLTSDSRTLLRLSFSVIALVGFILALTRRELGWILAFVGVIIGRFQGIGFKLADMATELRAAELMTLDAAWRHDQGTATDADIAMAKLKATEMLAMVADEAIQIHGGMGLMDELPLERIWRDARIERIWDGTSEIQRHIISRAMLRPLGA